MEKSSKRGKIPQHDWPSIISRYEAGETLASIARTYDCSPPAISYIVSRTRARSLASEASPAKTDGLTTIEPQLVKASSAITTNDMADGELMHNSDPPVDGKQSAIHAVEAPGPSEQSWFPDAPSPLPSGPAPGLRQDDGSMRRAADAPGNGRTGEGRIADIGTKTGNGSSRPPASSGAQPAGEVRRTLHLALPQGNGAGPHPATHNTPHSGQAPDTRANTGQPTQSELAFQPRQTSQAPASPPLGIRDPLETGEPSKARDGGAFIDRALRERINDDIAAFLAAFDTALDHDTVESRTGLREATDRLLRAGARTRIELERLEARLPLPARDSGHRPFPAPRPR